MASAISFSSNVVSSPVGAAGAAGVGTGAGAGAGGAETYGVLGATGTPGANGFADGAAAPKGDAPPPPPPKPSNPPPKPPPPSICCCTRAIALGSCIIWFSCCIIAGFCWSICSCCESMAGFCSACAIIGFICAICCIIGSFCSICAIMGFCSMLCVCDAQFELPPTAPAPNAGGAKEETEGVALKPELDAATASSSTRLPVTRTSHFSAVGTSTR